MILNGLEATDMVWWLPMPSVLAQIWWWSAKLSSYFSAKIGMAWHQWTSRSQYHSSTSLIRPIWRISSSLKATDMVWWLHKWHQLLFRFDYELPNFHLISQCKNWHGLAPTNQQKPVSLFNITNQTHMEDIQWSGGNWYGFLMTLNAISFGSDWMMKCQTFI